MFNQSSNNYRNSLLLSYLNPSTTPNSAAPSTSALLTALNRAYKSKEKALWLHSWNLIKFTRDESDNDSDLFPDGEDSKPGQEELAHRVWEHARRRGEDQVVVVSGIAGSGKSNTIQTILSQLTTLASQIPSSQSTTQRLTTLLSSAQTILTSLTHATTPSNPSTSFHSGVNVTISLDLYGAIASANISCPYVDASRLTNLPSAPGNRSFSIFYQFLRGASPQEQATLSLLKPENYAYLSKSGTYDLPSGLNIDDGAAADDFRDALRVCGIQGKRLRGIYQTLAGCLLLGNLKFSTSTNSVLNLETLEDAALLLDLDPDQLLALFTSSSVRDDFVQEIYRALVSWFVSVINNQLHPQTEQVGADISIIEIPSPSGGDSDGGWGSFVRAWIAERLVQGLWRQIFDDGRGLNKEMVEDGVKLVKVAVEDNSDCVELMQKIANITTTLHQEESLTSKLTAEWASPSYKSDTPNDFALRHIFALGDWVKYDSLNGFPSVDLIETMEKESQEGTFFHEVLSSAIRNGDGRRSLLSGKIDALCLRLENARMWNVLCLKPGADITSAWDVGLVSAQVRTFRLAQELTRQSGAVFTADFTIPEFFERYVSIIPNAHGMVGMNHRDIIISFLEGRRLGSGEWLVGKDKVWIGEIAWENLEGELDDCIAGARGSQEILASPLQNLDTPGTPMILPDRPDTFFYQGGDSAVGSMEGLLNHPSLSKEPLISGNTYSPPPSGDKSYYYGMDGKEHIPFDTDMESKAVEITKQSFTRKVWLVIVWTFTWPFLPIFLRYIGRMKRRDVQMAWREKVTLCALITLLCGVIIFYIIFFQKLICPEFDTVWNAKEVGEHQGDNDFFVSVRGGVYDLSKFWRLDHSDSSIPTNAANMGQFAGEDLTSYFPFPLTQACPQLVKDTSLALIINSTLATDATAIHFSGPKQGDTTSALAKITWYKDVFVPKITQYYKGRLVVSRGDVNTQGQTQGRTWSIVNGAIYDLSDYFNTLAIFNNAPNYQFLDPAVSALFQANPGLDATDSWNKLDLDAATKANNLGCIKNLFFVGTPDMRNTARCQINNYLLLVFTVIICATILVKFVAALQFGTKRSPARQDRYVVCQIPAYTEGEEQLRKAIDSLTFLNYDDKKKLLFIIADGTITGSGNENVPTHRIILDILGSDPKIDPPAYMFKSVAEGSKQLNYGKVYSGLYEYEGHVVPYVVVHKCGQPSEKYRPGNRGKRDSQIILFNFLNRCHFEGEMTPLELEIYHQIANVIGINPRMYEYLMTVDADTEVTEDSLNRLVACCANDSKIVGICGETSLQNEERSWWTMIQVYEYYISHALAKSFESLFGSVTCLPGCFSLFRIKGMDRGTAKGRPYLIHPDLIAEYADNKVDTLHKKNLLHLGEDRYLTTLLAKHFPKMKTSFTPDALARTAAPDTWGVLVSQRRRWINSTIHNLAELVLLDNLCGFCCFSMRFVVFIDLFGTLILPATVVYLGYLIYKVSTHQGQFPLIAIVLLAAIYGLQALVFILKRRWQHVGWMIVYLLAYPIYAFALPVYSFWHMDDFNWGNTRVVVGEKGGKRVIASAEEERFDDRDIPMKRWEVHAAEQGLPIGPPMEKIDENIPLPTYKDDFLPPGPQSIPGWQQESKSISDYGGSKAGVGSMYGGRQSQFGGPQSQYGSRQSQFGGPQSQYGSRQSQARVSVRQPGRESMYATSIPPSQFSHVSQMKFSGPRTSETMEMHELNTPHHSTVPFQKPRSSFRYEQSQSRPVSAVARSDFTGYDSRLHATPTVRDSTVLADVSSGTTNDDDASVSIAQNVVRKVLREVDMHTTTTKQVRALVEAKLGIGRDGHVSPEQRKALDDLIDKELEEMM